MFNESIDDKDGGDAVRTVIDDWTVGDRDNMDDNNSWTVDEIDDKDGWLGVVWTIVDWILGGNNVWDVCIVECNVTVMTHMMNNCLVAVMCGCKLR